MSSKIGQINQGEQRAFGYELTPIIKGIAIILMFALHPLKPEWMSNPNIVLDISIRETTLSAILARGGDICIGIFAFVTGYGWAETYDSKSKFARILGAYRVYWFVLLVFAFPMRVLFSELNGSGIQLSLNEVMRSITAVGSLSIRFGWYIYFFALAVITYPFIIKSLDTVKISGVLLCYFVCVISIILRFGSRILFTRFLPVNDALEIFSHYFQWMPVVVIGHLSNKKSIIDKADITMNQRIGEKKVILYALLFIVLYVGKCAFMFITGIYSNFDSLIMLPFMIALVGVAGWLDKRRRIKMLLSFLGGLSMYLWLSHGFILYPQVQAVVLSVRLPILILLLSFGIMIPIAYLLRESDMFLVESGQRLLRKL